jgi:hypothetical protein
MFNIIADANAGYRKADDAARLRSGGISGIRCLPVTYR